ncbi:MAG: Crp/Fnr family transcriptional regulator [Bacteroidales bacterium]|nr:Crp/Fnr family transcriptional regulator [Bacteroidales bacterium]
MEGNKPHGVFCVKSGRIKIFKHGSYGREHITRLAFPGEFIGLKALLTGTPYSVSAQALEDSVLCFIGKNEFFQLTLRYPEFTSALIAFLSKQLVDAEDKMISMAHKPVRERLANTLLYLYQNFLVPSVPPENTYLNLTRQDLANIVGAAPETVIRLLTEWKEKKIVSIKGRKIFIHDEDRLKKIACSIP